MIKMNNTMEMIIVKIAIAIMILTNIMTMMHIVIII